MFKETYHASISLNDGVVNIDDLIGRGSLEVNFSGYPVFSFVVQPFGGDIRYSVDNNDPIAGRFSPIIKNGTEKVFNGYNKFKVKIVANSLNPATHVFVAVNYTSPPVSKVKKSVKAFGYNGIVYGYNGTAFSLVSEDR